MVCPYCGKEIERPTREHFSRNLFAVTGGIFGHAILVIS